MTHKLHLIDLNADGDATEPAFAQEENKKSSFILEQCPVNLCIQKQSDASNSNEQAHNSLSASASISCSISDSDETETLYLFGGFELIASIKSTEVYVTPSESTTTAKQEENYITTCKGIPQRDNENEDLGPWFKFIFVLPGGPKPVTNVRLKFKKPCDDSTSCIITIRALKLKGRLTGDMPKSTTLQNQGRANQMPVTHTSNNDPRNAMTAMMAQMRLSSMGQGMPMMMPFSQQPSIPMQSPHQQHHCQSSQQQQQQNHEEQEKNQAEIISSIVGLGMFLKSSEERTISAVEKMISGMESRIMERLDDLSTRIDTIEQNHNENKTNAQE